MVTVALPAAAEERVIAILGDSLTAGYGLAPDQGLVPQLQVWLDANGGDVRLINAGVSGDTTAGGLARLDWTLTPEVDGLAVALGGNDLLRGIDPATSRANIRAILDAAQKRDLPVLLIAAQAPANYGTEFSQAFDAIFPELAQEYSARLAPPYFSAFGVDSLSAMTPFLQGDALHPNPEGVAKIVTVFGPILRDFAASLPPDAPDSP